MKYIPQANTEKDRSITELTEVKQGVKTRIGNKQGLLDTPCKVNVSQNN